MNNSLEPLIFRLISIAVTQIRHLRRVTRPSEGSSTGQP